MFTLISETPKFQNGIPSLGKAEINPPYSLYPFEGTSVHFFWETPTWVQEIRAAIGAPVLVHLGWAWKDSVFTTLGDRSSNSSFNKPLSGQLLTVRNVE